MYGNEPTKPPDMEARWRAWRIRGGEDGKKGSIGSDWLIHAPGAHPFWWWYAVSVVHLRAQKGLPEPVIGREGATHEILCLSLSPEHPLPDVDNWRAMRYLTPPDFARQFAVNDDEQARELGDLVVRHICDGHSPDQDFRSYWNTAIEKTAEHLRTGGHE